MVGWNIDEGELCLKIQGTLTERYGREKTTDTYEMWMAPRSGRVRKVMFTIVGGGYPKILRLLSPFRPNAEPLGPATRGAPGTGGTGGADPPTAEGVTAVAPPLPSSRWRAAALQVKEARTRDDNSARLKALEAARAAADERGGMEVGPGWYWGGSTWAREVEGTLGPGLRSDFGGVGSGKVDPPHDPIARGVKQHIAQWDAGSWQGINVLARQASGAPPAMRGLAASVAAHLFKRRSGEIWEPAGAVTLTNLVTGESGNLVIGQAPALYQSPDHQITRSLNGNGQSLAWVVQGGRLTQVDRTSGRTSPLWRDHDVIAAEGPGPWLLQSKWASNPKGLALAAWTPGEADVRMMTCPVDPLRAPWHVLTEVSRSDRVYLISAPSVGRQCQALLSAWDPVHQRWIFQDLWLATAAFQEGGLRKMTVRSAMSPDRSTLAIWCSTGWVACVDAEAGKMTWARNLEGSRTTIQVTDDAVWCADASGRALSVYDRRTGKALWHTAPPEQAQWIGAQDGVGYVISDRGLTAFDEADGRERWQWPWPGGERLGGRAALAEGRVWIPSARKIYVVDAETGRLETSWNRPPDPPSAWGEVVVTPDPDLTVWMLTADRLEWFRPRTLSADPVLPGGK